MDKGTILGILVAAGAILLGLTLEGGKVGQIMQPTAALIVFGGTLGAVLVQFPIETVLTAFARIARILFVPKNDAMHAVQEIVSMAQKARRDGLISLDANLESIQDPFLRKSVMLAVDGTEPGELRKIMEVDLIIRSEQSESTPKVFEAAGSFSPTIGIIGAVLGLIQVMQHLDNIDEVGWGIAVAFVATVYGVGAANLILLPFAGKLKIRNREEELIHELMLEGVISIIEGMNPRIIESKLVGFLSEQPADERASRTAA